MGYRGVSENRYRMLASLDVIVQPAGFMAAS